jgi:hypothetical protein
VVENIYAMEKKAAKVEGGRHWRFRKETVKWYKSCLIDNQWIRVINGDSSNK